MIPFCKKLFVLFLLFSVLSFPAIPEPDTNVSTEPVVFSNIAQSEKRILKKNLLRDKKILSLTGYNSLAKEIIAQHSLIVGSSIVLVSQSTVYSWLVDHIRVSAALSRFFGMNYLLTPGSVYEYHGEDSEGLSVDFNNAYSDSTSTIYVGEGEIKIFLFSITGSFVNFLEYNDTKNKTMIAQSCIYVRVNNPVTRIVTNFIFAISDLEKGVMEKILTLDDTVYKIVLTFMEDPHLYLMLKKPEAHAPDKASELAVRIRDTVVQESSLKESRELGQLVEKARLEVGY
ncbi:hypothetical protein ACFL1R_06695 [Candidatus Latescibacterota bacterium]